MLYLDCNKACMGFYILSLQVDWVKPSPVLWRNIRGGVKEIFSTKYRLINAKNHLAQAQKKNE